MNQSPTGTRHQALKNMVYSPAMTKFQMSSALRVSMKSAGTTMEKPIGATESNDITARM